MRIYCRIELDICNHIEVVARDLPSIADRYFEPIAVTDVPLIGMATGELTLTSIEHEMALKLREDAVDHLSKGLAKHLIDALKKRDTLNGWTLKPDDDN